MDFDQSMILDATRGSIARFVNHSCSPNCRMAKWTVQGKPRMALFAGDNGIMTGEELTYDYNFNPFSVKNIQECRCGADNCRGVLGPKPKEAKDREIREALNPIAGGGKRKIQQMAENAIEGVKNVAKKRKLNVPGPTSIKNAMMKAQIGIPPKPMAEPIIQRTPQRKIEEKVREKEKPKKGTKPKLPIGWVYTAELDEPPPPVVRNVFATDPEVLLRSQKRKTEHDTEEAGTAHKKQRRTASDETLVQQSNKNSGSDRVKEEIMEEKQDDDEVDGDDRRRPRGRRASVRSRMGSVKDNLVRTVKGRQHITPRTPARQSVSVIDD